MGITGQEPPAIELFAVYRYSITGQLSRFSTCEPGNRQSVPAPRVRDYADDYDLFQFAVATDLNPLVRG